MRLDDPTLAAVVRELADAVVIADAGGTIVFWNAAASRLFGWSADDAVGQTLDLIIPQGLRDRHWAGYHETMRTGETKYADRLLEVPSLHRNGTTMSVGFTVTLLTSPATGAVTGIAAVLRDETARFEERRALRAEVKRLAR